MKAWSKAPQAFQIYECIPAWVAWQQSQRSPTLPEKVRAGINYSIILMSACYVEGFCELSLLRVAFDAMGGTDSLEERLVDDLCERISATTGSDRYNAMFETVLGTRGSDLLGDNQLWDSVKHLFHFRNMLAHGRSVSYIITFPPGTGGYWETEFGGGYEKIEEYLLKRGMLTEPHIEVADNYHYFKDPVADHFWGIAHSFVAKIQQKLPRGRT